MVDSTPQIHPLAGDPRRGASDCSVVHGTGYHLVGDVEPPLGEEFLDVAIARVKRR
jgi:hypothetical protein